MHNLRSCMAGSRIEYTLKHAQNGKFVQQIRTSSLVKIKLTIDRHIQPLIRNSIVNTNKLEGKLANLNQLMTIAQEHINKEKQKLNENH